VKKRVKPVVGWREWVELSAIKGIKIKAKIDTGARTSALHAFDVVSFRKRGADYVRFKIHPLQRDSKTVVMHEAELVEQRWVKSSSGHRKLRPVVVEQIQLMGQTWEIELTLTNRDEMGFRMLLGREAIRNRFVVDPGRSFLAGKKPLQKPGQPKKAK
jgi:hypothetical protein